MSQRRRQRDMPVSSFLTEGLEKYDVTAFPEELLYRDQVVSVLGAPMEGWVPELVFRYAVFQPQGLNVDWAIMLNTFREEDGASGPRRSIERIDICHSEVHIHRFRRSDDPSDDLGERKKVVSLYAGDEVTVSQQYDVQMALLSREWESRMRRWIDG